MDAESFITLGRRTEYSSFQRTQFVLGGSRGRYKELLSTAYLSVLLVTCGQNYKDQDVPGRKQVFPPFLSIVG